MAKKQQKFIIKAPKSYNVKVLNLQKWINQYNPFIFVDNLCRLKGLKEIKIIHKPLKLSAEFKLPNKIFVDLRNSKNYILLCLAHEYTHLLLRAHISISYPVEQSLAILLQLAYENCVNIRKFTQKTAKELMQLMNVWPVGKILLKNWASYWSFKTGKTGKYRNILAWLKKINPNLLKKAL